MTEGQKTATRRTVFIVACLLMVLTGSIALWHLTPLVLRSYPTAPETLAVWQAVQAEHAGPAFRWSAAAVACIAIMGILDAIDPECSR